MSSDEVEMCFNGIKYYLEIFKRGPALSKNVKMGDETFMITIFKSISTGNTEEGTLEKCVKMISDMLP